MAMDIARWDPFKEISNLREEIDRIFDSFVGRVPATAEREYTWLPAINLEETDDEFIVKVELPGMKKEDVKISVSEDALTISGERKMEKEEKGKTYHRVEMAYGKFQRTITFPVEVKPDKAKATYKDGILTITVPKSEKARPREIEIEIK